MTQITTNQRTFSKQSKRMIKELVKNAAYYKKAINGNYLIKDKNNETVATWHKPSESNKYGLIIIF